VIPEGKLGRAKPITQLAQFLLLGINFIDPNRETCTNKNGLQSEALAKEGLSAEEGLLKAGKPNHPGGLRSFI
jgi:hypothetical protein